MIYKSYTEKIEVPEAIMKEFLKTNEVTENFNDDFEDWFFDYQEKFIGTICDKEIAEFMVAFETTNIPAGGGYPIRNYFTFEENGYRYTVIAFGWTSECEENKGNLYMIVYKESYSPLKNI